MREGEAHEHKCWYRVGRSEFRDRQVLSLVPEWGLNRAQSSYKIRSTFRPLRYFGALAIVKQQALYFAPRAARFASVRNLKAFSLMNPSASR